MCRKTENGSNWHLIFPPSPPRTELHLNNLDSGTHTPRDKCVLEKRAGSLLMWEKMTHIHCQTHIQAVTDMKSFLLLCSFYIYCFSCCTFEKKTSVRASTLRDPKLPPLVDLDADPLIQSELWEISKLSSKDEHGQQNRAKSQPWAQRWNTSWPRWSTTGQHVTASRGRCDGRRGWVLCNWNHLTLFFCLPSGPVLFAECESRTQVRGSLQLTRFILRGTWPSERLSRSFDKRPLRHVSEGKYIYWMSAWGFILWNHAHRSKMSRQSIQMKVYRFQSEPKWWTDQPSGLHAATRVETFRG